MRGLNLGSGQRRFEPTPEMEWINVDATMRPPDQVPDIVMDIGAVPLPFDDNSIDYCVLNQVVEHFGCGEADGLIRECYRTLRPGGTLIITVPDIRALAQRWLVRGIDDYIYIVNLMGAYQGHDGDRHKWHYSRAGLMDLFRRGGFTSPQLYDWSYLQGSHIPKDWWILGMKGVK